MPDPVFITSASNPFVKSLIKLAQDPAAYRKQGQVWLEGDHLCNAALARGVAISHAVLSDTLWRTGGAANLVAAAEKCLVLDDAILAKISTLPSPSNVGCVIDSAALLQQASYMDAQANTVVLDRIQDAGNVGSILRSASALGFKQVLALQGTAALWSPKVLRAGMGAHFSLQLFEGLQISDLDHLQVPLLATHLQGTALLHQAQLPHPCAWIFGHEGQGVAPELVSKASLLVRIEQPGGEESLNVAAAAAICLFTSSTRANG